MIRIDGKLKTLCVVATAATICFISNANSIAAPDFSLGTPTVNGTNVTVKATGSANDCIEINWLVYDYNQVLVGSGYSPPPPGTACSSGSGYAAVTSSTNVTYQTVIACSGGTPPYSVFIQGSGNKYGHSVTVNNVGDRDNHDANVSPQDPTDNTFTIQYDPNHTLPATFTDGQKIVIPVAVSATSPVEVKLRYTAHYYTANDVGPFRIPGFPMHGGHLRVKDGDSKTVNAPLTWPAGAVKVVFFAIGWNQNGFGPPSDMGDMDTLILQKQ